MDISRSSSPSPPHKHLTNPRTSGVETHPLARNIHHSITTTQNHRNLRRSHNPSCLSEHTPKKMIYDSTLPYTPSCLVNAHPARTRLQSHDPTAPAPQHGKSNLRTSFTNVGRYILLFSSHNYLLPSPPSSPPLTTPPRCSGEVGQSGMEAHTTYTNTATCNTTSRDILPHPDHSPIRFPPGYLSIPKCAKQPPYVSMLFGPTLSNISKAAASPLSIFIAFTRGGEREHGT
ncbi:hypothetical protein F5Y02DRAFT_293824 [Annulohypoxylon stygium]|nr:hypothetical protein F5Y02DRAFT_293824 [Annulohypoxylon stygium]